MDRRALYQSQMIGRRCRVRHRVRWSAMAGQYSRGRDESPDDRSRSRRAGSGSLDVQPTRETMSDAITIQRCDQAVRRRGRGGRPGPVRAAGRSTGSSGPTGRARRRRLRMIMHILLPDSGEIEVLGERGTRAAHDRVSYLPEERGPLQANDGAAAAPLLRRAQGRAAARARPRDRRLAGSDGPARLDRQEGRGALQGDGPEDPVHRRRCSTAPSC